MSPGLVVITSSNKHALVLFCVDQPGAERNLSGLTAVHWRTLSYNTMHLYCSVLMNQKPRGTLSYNNHALVLFCVNESEAKGNFVL